MIDGGFVNYINTEKKKKRMSEENKKKIQSVAFLKKLPELNKVQMS